MARLTPDTLDPAEMHLSPAEVGALLSWLPADHPLVASARVGVELADERYAAAVRNRCAQADVREAVRERGYSNRRDGGQRAERRDAWDRQAAEDGEDSAAAEKVAEIDAEDERQAWWARETEPWPDDVYERADATTKRWIAEHQAEREAADDDRRRFADSDVDYSDSDEDVDDDADVA